MASVQHTCTGCVPIDASIIDVYVTLVNTNKHITIAETDRAAAEDARETAETERASLFATDHGRAVADHSIAESDHQTASADHASTVAVIAEANAAAAIANAKAELVQARLDTADADHTRAEGDHGTAVSDHSSASTDHTMAQSDHETAGNDHTRAESDHSIAASDHTASASATAAATGAAELANTKAGLVQEKLDRADTDHARAESDHTIATSDHTAATADHAQASADHTQAGADHGTAVADHTSATTDHTQAGADHTLAAADHGTAGEDHEQALADHQVMAGYDTRLGNVDGKISQLRQDIEEIREELILSSAVAGLHFDSSLQHILARQAIKAVWLTYGSSVTTDTQRAQVDALYAQLKTTKLYITDLYNVSGTYGCFLQIKDAETGGTNCFSRYEAGIHTISGEEEVWNISCRQNTILWPADSALNTYPFAIHFAIDWNVLNNKEVTRAGDNAIEIDFGELNWGERKETETIKEAVEGLQQNSTSISSIDLSGKTIVCIGDSLTEMVDTTNNKHYSDYIAERTGATCINIGFGGTMLRQRTTMAEDFDALPESTDAEVSAKSRKAYATIDIINLVRAIVANDFTEQTKAVNWLANHNDDNRGILSRVKAIDWSSVDGVTIFAGTNDWGSNNPVLGTSGSIDINYTLGAINEIVRLLMSTFKHLKIYTFTPIVRWMDYSGGTGTDAEWSDVRQYGDGTLRYFSEQVQKEWLLNHLPCCDMYNTLGWNKNNFSEYFTANDGTHPRTLKGVTFLAKKMGAFILANNTL